MYKLLIADDEKIIRESVSQMIDWDALNIRITACCKDGMEALEAIMDTAPDIVVTDIRMPGMDGLELIRQMRVFDPRIQFIILSGHPEFEYARRALKYGAREYLLKPISEEAVIEAVKNASDALSKGISPAAGDRRGLANQESPLLAHIAEGKDSRLISETVKNYVSSHFADENLSLKYIAENTLYLNVNYLSRIFTKQSGEKFSYYLNRLRIENAKKLLSRNAQGNIHAIAEAVGFGGNPRYFSQVFKKYAGMTPSQYAEELAGRKKE